MEQLAPAAVSEQTATAASGSFAKASMFACRAAGVWSPRIDEERTPRRAAVSSTASITNRAHKK